MPQIILGLSHVLQSHSIVRMSTIGLKKTLVWRRNERHRSINSLYFWFYSWFYIIWLTMNKDILIEEFNTWWEEYIEQSAKEFSSQDEYFKETGEAFRIFTGGYLTCLNKRKPGG